MFEYSIAEARAQLSALPLGVVVWVRWLGAVNLMSLFFLRRVQARWVLAAMLFVLATNVPILMSLGLVKLTAIPHLIVWVPLTVYLASELRSGRVDLRARFGVWTLALVATLCVSSVFDIRDGAEYLLGDREIITAKAGAPSPVVTLLFVAASLVVLFAYALRLPRRQFGAGQEGA